jgi:hypothetical protein
VIQQLHALGIYLYLLLPDHRSVIASYFTSLRHEPDANCVARHAALCDHRKVITACFEADIT